MTFDATVEGAGVVVRSDRRDRWWAVVGTVAGGYEVLRSAGSGRARGGRSHPWVPATTDAELLVAVVGDEAFVMVDRQVRLVVPSVPDDETAVGLYAAPEAIGAASWSSVLALPIDAVEGSVGADFLDQSRADAGDGPG